MAVARERLQPLGVADPLGRLLPEEEVAAAPHDGERGRRRGRGRRAATRSGRRGRRPSSASQPVSPGRGPAAVGCARRGGRSRVARYSIDAARRRNSSTTPSRTVCSSGPMPSKLTPNTKPPRGAGPRPAHGGGDAHVGSPGGRGAPRRSSVRADRRRLDLGVDAPPARAEVGQEAREALVADDVAAGRHERLDPLGACRFSSGSGHGRGAALRSLLAFGCGDAAPRRSWRRC